jgi:hypothetical protein
MWTLFIGECPHLFDLAYILFYFKVVMEVIIGRHVAHEKGHTCDLACSCT